MSPRDLVEDTFRALRVRNYRWFVAGQLVSLSGSWMETVALGWLVLRLSGSGVALGLVTALQFLPALLFGLWGGLIADRFDRRRVLIATQSAFAMQAAVLGALTITGSARLWMLAVLAFAFGCVMAVDNPARQAFVIEMVGPDDVANAVGLNSATFNAARMIGPVLAGVVIASTGEGAAFLINAATFAPVIVWLWRMDRSELHPGLRLARGPGQLREALRYAWTNPRARFTLGLLGVLTTFGLNLYVVGPLLARFVFDAGARGYALLTAGAGAGALFGALLTARRARPTGAFLAGAALLTGIGGLAGSVAPSLAWASLAFALVGGAGMAFIVTANSTLQLEVPAALRGRVMAIYTLVLFGGAPFGGPIVGWISERSGPRVGLAFGSAIVSSAGTVALRLAARRRTAVASAS